MATRWTTDFGAVYQGRRGVVYAMGNLVAENMAAAAMAANSNTARQVLAMAEIHARGIAPAERTAMNDALGQMGQKSMLASYDASVTRARSRSGNIFPYRVQARGKNRRYAGGALRKVLAAKSFYEATPDSLLFINESKLNQKARHWMRLNAGAGRRAGPARGPMSVRWSNVVVGVIGIDMAPRPGFGMPKGYWVTPGGEELVSASADRRGSDEFYPAGTGPFAGRTALGKRPTKKNPNPKPGLMAGRGGKRPTKGIRGRHFLEAGTDRIAEEYPRAVEQLYRNLYREGVVGPNSSLLTNVPRPRSLKKGYFRL